MASATATSAAAITITNTAKSWPCRSARAEAREGHQVQVGRVQDQLDAHEHVHRVAPGEDAEQAEREEGGGDDQVVVEADHRASHASFRRRTIMAAPMRATSSRIGSGLERQQVRGP